MNTLARIASTSLVGAAFFGPAAAAAEPRAPVAECRMQTPPGPPPQLVELYTSEGCSSCPPADRWLAAMKSRPDLVPLGLHVNYWDYLGWRDRFASDATTQRQRSQRAAWGASQVYTPQVVVDGRDWPSWPRGLPAARREAAPVAATLERHGQKVTARIPPTPGAVPGDGTLAAWWAVVEDGHSSRVRAGENAGELLRHDHVVRQLRPVPAWPARAGAEFGLELDAAADPQHPRRVVLVVHAASGSPRPLQVAVLGC
jgi:hypothetical protein